MQLPLHYISLFRRTSSSLHARNTANEEQLLYASSPVFQRPALEADSCRKYNSWTLVQLELRSNSKLSAIPSSLRSPYAHSQNEVFMRISYHKCLIFLHFCRIYAVKNPFFCHLPPVLASTFEYHFFLMTKALRDIFSKSFLFIKIQIVPNPFARS